MNNFPAMTEEQRQELIKMAKALSSGVEGNLIANLAKVALAALTAQPDHYVFHHPAGKLLNYLASDECKGQEHVVAGYTVPPVPVLKPIELKRGALMISFYSTDPMNEDPVLCLSRDGVIEAICAAGYEVKQ